LYHSVAAAPRNLLRPVGHARLLGPRQADRRGPRAAAPGSAGERDQQRTARARHQREPAPDEVAGSRAGSL